jgi:hypothetical protein
LKSGFSLSIQHYAICTYSELQQYCILTVYSDVHSEYEKWIGSLSSSAVPTHSSLQIRPYTLLNGFVMDIYNGQYRKRVLFTAKIFTINVDRNLWMMCCQYYTPYTHIQHNSLRIIFYYIRFMYYYYYNFNKSTSLHLRSNVCRTIIIIAQLCL